MPLTEELNLSVQDDIRDSDEDSRSSDDDTRSSDGDSRSSDEEIPPVTLSKKSGKDHRSKVLDGADEKTAIGKGRGRPNKGGKTKHPEITATGKGRGRPKKIAKLDGDQNVNDQEVETATKTKPKKKSPGKSRGRPRKVKTSDDESSDDKNDDDDEEKRPVGRPSTGAVQLNILQTGRGQGRPKQKKKDSAGTGKRRGRPTIGKVRRPPYVPTGKPRGRPKSQPEVAEENGSDDKTDDDEEKRPVGGPSTGAVQLNILQTGRGQGRPKQKKKDSAGTGKRRGRPSIGKVRRPPYVPTGKPRGRPKSQPEVAEENGKLAVESSDE